MKHKILIYRTEIRMAEVEVEVPEGADILDEAQKIEGSIDFHDKQFVSATYSYGNLPMPEDIAAFDAAMLDNMVHDAAASGVDANNDGVQGQYDFLRSTGCSDDDIRNGVDEEDSWNTED